MNQTEQLTQKQIEERANFELDDLQKELEHCETQAHYYASKITIESKKLEAMISSEDFKPATLRPDHLGWIEQYTQNYKEWVTKGDTLKTTIKGLEYATQLIRGKTQ